eukprot:TCONS_00071944-protein
MREIERNTFHQKGKSSRTLGSMVRFPNLMNRSIFRTKGLSPEVGKVNHKTVDDSIEEKTLKIDEVNGKEVVSGNIPSLQTHSVDCEEKLTLKTGLLLDQEREGKCSGNDKMELKGCIDEDLEGRTVDELQEQIRNMKRTYLFEQNHLMEGCELEKFELRESYEEEKTRLKKAFENEKTELLKEIERKDKMLEKLADVLKEQHQKDLEMYKTKIEEEFNTKYILCEKFNKTLQTAIENVQRIIQNNEQTFGNLHEFKTLKECKTQMNDLILKKDSGVFNAQNETIGGGLIRSISDPTQQRRSEESAVVKCKLNETKARSFEYESRSDDDIQHEMADVYRKQKAELVKLFTAEKDEDRQRLRDEKERFEREVRTEYDSRMIVERNAWRDTIEDLEREINILKFEREQLDRNYCLGMDEMRTEFEVEKQQMYRRFSETQTMYQNKLRDFRKDVMKEKKVCVSD